MNLLDIERELWAAGKQVVAGIDEAGRGPLAGPVVVASVVFKPGQAQIPGVNDSKKLSAKMREAMYDEIIATASQYYIAVIDHTEVDRLNILQATYAGMRQCTEKLNSAPDYLLIDGKRGPEFDCPYRYLVKGDSRSMSVAAASILAKVTRDRIMVEYDAQYPAYGFARHKGYPTKFHVTAIREYGFCPIHRRSFRPKALEDLYDALRA